MLLVVVVSVLVLMLVLALALAPALLQHQRQPLLIVLLYYYEGMTMKEISLTFDISESRVCQMHTMILAKLRSQLRRHEMTTTAALA